MENLYTDWAFWAVVISLLALVLSQLPPISMLLRTKKIVIEPYSLITLTHRVGNPNIRWGLGFRNVSGSTIRVKSVSCELINEGTNIAEMGGHHYFRPDDNKTMIFTGFSLRPDEEIFYEILFFKMFDRFENRDFRNNLAALKNDINTKRTDMSEADLAEADSNLVQPFIDMFNQKFVLNPGEYRIRLKSITEPASAISNRDYRFTLFESDSNELREYSKGYKYGDGIYYDSSDKSGVFINIEEV